MLVAATFCNQALSPEVALAVIDTGTGWARLVDLGTSNGDTGATGFAAHEDGFIVCVQGSDRLIRLNRHLDPVESLQIQGLQDVHSCAVEDGLLWLVSTGSDSVVACGYSGSGFEVQETVELGDGPSDTVHVNAISSHNARLLVTSFGAQWRTRPKHACTGVILDLGSGDIVANGLAQPHSLSSHAGRLFVLSSYEGTIQEILAEGRLLRASVGGYLRGLAVGSWGAVVGVSGRRRRSRVLGTDNTDRDGFEERCLILQFDQHWRKIWELDISWLAREVYDLVPLMEGHLRRPDAADALHAARTRIAALEARLDGEPSVAAARSDAWTTNLDPDAPSEP